MSVTVVVGLQWGDEGKGKIVDLLAEKFDIIARYQGGANAGHTIVIAGTRRVFHLVPSGILSARQCVLGNGMVIDPIRLREEIDDLHRSGVETSGRLWISSGAHLLLPTHAELDRAAEHSAGAGKIGTTGRGIGPAYSDKIRRRGVRAGMPLDDPRTIEVLIEDHTAQLDEYGLRANPEEIERWWESYRTIAPMIRDTGSLLRAAIRRGEKILAEGAQGTLLDIDHGSYPYVTSSTTTAAGAASGLGVPPKAITHVIGVFKAYVTRVGEGPFPTELDNLLGEELRTAGAEYGATTGRPRRCGWLDLPALKYAAEINGCDEMIMAKADVLTTALFPEAQIGVAYEIDEEFSTDLARVTVRYETVPLWPNPVHEKLDAYCAKIEAHVGVPITGVSTGAERDDIFWRVKVSRA